MDINLTPAVKIALMGGAGYFFGQCARINPKLAALTFIISEVAAQIFSYLNQHYNWGFSDNIGGALGCSLSAGYIKIQNSAYPIFALIAISFACGLCSAFLNESKVKTILTIG